jgi:hypothetical protein
MDTAELFFDDVGVPVANLLGEDCESLAVEVGKPFLPDFAGVVANCYDETDSGWRHASQVISALTGSPAS